MIVRPHSVPPIPFPRRRAPIHSQRQRRSPVVPVLRRTSSLHPRTPRLYPRSYLTNQSPKMRTCARGSELSDRRIPRRSLPRVRGPEAAAIRSSRSAAESGAGLGFWRRSDLGGEGMTSRRVARPTPSRRRVRTVATRRGGFRRRARGGAR